MASVAVLYRILLKRHRTTCPAVLSLQQYFSSEVHSKKFPEISTELAALKRGTGGRSSFNGVVATVFGANGFLGGHVVNRLGKQGTQVIIPYRGDHYDVLRLKLCGDLGQILFTHFNLKDEDSLYKAMKYSNVVINLIGREFETSNFSFEDVHVTGPRNIARIARQCGVQRLIHVSALNCVEKPKPVITKNGSKFLASKWRGEIAVREEFPEAIIFRPSDIYGPEDNFIRYYAHWARCWNHKLPVWKKGKEVFKQPVFVQDVAQGIVKAVFEPDSVGNTYQAVGPHRYELGELLDWFYRIMKKSSELWGYKRTDMRYDLFFWARVFLCEMLFMKYPVLTWEKIEREHTTDILTRGMPSLEDLGVTLTKMEDRLVYDLKPYRAYAYYDAELTEYMRPVESAPVVNN